MKFGWLIECNLYKIIFYSKKLYAKYRGESSPRLFSEKCKLTIYLDQHSEFYTVCFYCKSNSMTTKYIETEAATWGVLEKKVSLEILQNSQENTRTRDFLK